VDLYTFCADGNRKEYYKIQLPYLTAWRRHNCVTHTLQCSLNQVTSCVLILLLIKIQWNKIRRLLKIKFWSKPAKTERFSAVIDSQRNSITKIDKYFSGSWDHIYTAVHKNLSILSLTIIPVFLGGFFTFCTDGNRKEYYQIQLPYLTARWRYTCVTCTLQCSLNQVTSYVKVKFSVHDWLSTIRHKTDHFGDVLPGQSLGLVLKFSLWLLSVLLFIFFSKFYILPILFTTSATR